MSNLPISSKYRSTPQAPVDDRERESIVARVNAAFEQGKLDDWTYRRALDAAFAAQTLGELAPVVEQLPPQATYDVPAIVDQGTRPPGEVSEIRAPANKTVMTVVGGVAAAIVLLVVLLVVLL
ncbi:DUF1707 SHOCT-like domain-containing protein [Nigerium massiliense]|uniref:DUF1707 SHOCT-like domain-containing protein n=1 Tax=Nigerium massiliense TaxID=1522317 RepID=UPI000694B624|nr:DUF1707 domain-containing protein [Nigerium massiliense]